MDKVEKKQKDRISKAYEKYVKQFTPSPDYVGNGVKAFLVGGVICAAALWGQNMLAARGLSEEDAGTWVTVGLIMAAQLLTGLGVFDSLAKFAGAGVIVPITGFANSMVAPAIEYKKEGPVLGAGAKLFSVAGPVLVCGITSASLVGAAAWAVSWLKETM